MIRESIKMSWQNIISNKMRSFLTILGILIGVTAIIALITIVQGVTNEITSQFSDLGANSVSVQVSGTPLKAGLNDGDVKLLEEIDNVESVSPTLSVNGVVEREGTVKEDAAVQGRNHIYFENYPDTVIRGRNLTILDMDSRNKVCIIDEVISNELFFGTDPLGKSLRINGLSFTVVGISGEDSNTSVLQPSADENGKIIIPYKTAMSMSGVGTIHSLEIRIADSDRTDETVASIEASLDKAFSNKEDSYHLTNMDQLLDTLDSTTDMLTTMLAGIASISLLVGGIGIMNMMLVSVKERTNEIGLRKALGAEPKRIQFQFLIESIFLSLFGGMIGVILGVTISWAAAALLNIGLSLSISAIALGVGFSGAIGIVFGWAPARNASKLNPIDALRGV
ncbi:ABC transporter permease [Clostridiales bacterium BAD-6]|uniref:ABC transporter permease n=2 Tax=Sinanaerobacter chloroacetimidivorans TaxID=2818044 RepID=A0A8J7VZ40_9FIRM|nr:ABC transporter permease [Sinanaerobacter chloroacetimidivorans]